MIVGTLVTYYNSIILAALHRFNGTRHKRYADLGQDIFGELRANTCIVMPYTHCQV